MLLARPADGLVAYNQSGCETGRIMATRGRYSGLRRELALAFSEGWRTRHEVARLLGRRTSDISGLVQRMHAEGILEANSSVPTRGTEFRLLPAAARELEDALDKTADVGQLAKHQQVLLVGDSGDPLAIQRIIARPILSACIAWVATIGGSGARLIAVQDGSDREVDVLHAEICAAGLSCTRSMVWELLDGDAARRRATTQRTVEAMS